mgnify:CR=1 FL=1|jgi:glutathione S-transferase
MGKMTTVSSERAGSDQSGVDATYQLYKTDLCGFCFRVRGFIDERGLQVTLRDIQREGEAFRELLKATGRATVPCLRIEEAGQVRWMHESMDIITFLAQRHGLA